MQNLLIITGAHEADSTTAGPGAIADAMLQAVAVAGESGIRPAQVQVVTPSELATSVTSGLDWLVCPLTLELPDGLDFPARTLFERCRSVEALRQMVASWGEQTGEGTAWLPIVWTAKGPLYGEAIAPHGAGYTQPLHLSDALRQPLYALGNRLLRSLEALPAVYLLQFGYAEQGIWFDRLIPFPAEPAIASVGVQSPDLFQCHWRCLTNQPILELLI